MRKSVVSAALVVCVFGSAFAKDDDVDGPLSRLGAAAADCANRESIHRPWCIAAKEWRKGKADVPKKTLLGISVEIPSYAMGDKPYRDAMIDKLDLVALAVSGNKVSLIPIKATAKGDEDMIWDAHGSLAVLFKGNAKTAMVKKNLATKLKRLEGNRPATKGPASTTWTGDRAGQLRRVGKFWVAVETKANRVWVSVLTDAWQ